MEEINKKSTFKYFTQSAGNKSEKTMEGSPLKAFSSGTIFVGNARKIAIYFERACKRGGFRLRR